MKNAIISLYAALYLLIISLLPYRPLSEQEEHEHAYADSWVWGVDDYPDAHIRLNPNFR